jgi:uncharacterized protein YbcI
LFTISVGGRRRLFLFASAVAGSIAARSDLMSSIAQQVAIAIRDFQEQRTGHAPAGVNVVLSNDTVVITLQNALTSAERLLSRTPAGAAQVQEFHQRLFESSVNTLKQEIERITGVAVREAAAEIDTNTGAVIHVFTTGTMVQVFQLAGGLASESWDDSRSVPSF